MTQAELSFDGKKYPALIGQKLRIYQVLLLALKNDPFKNGGWLPNWFFANEMHILKYTGRLSEMRQKGIGLEDPRQDDKKSKTYWYKLKT